MKRLPLSMATKAASPTSRFFHFSFPPIPRALSLLSYLPHHNVLYYLHSIAVTCRARLASSLRPFQPPALLSHIRSRGRSLPQCLSKMSATITLQQRIEVKDVVEIAEQAGAAIMQIYNSEKGHWQVEQKADTSPLTRADREANTIICDGLMRIAPHVPIVSEENKQLPYEIRKNYQYSWCVDPLDGTKEFIKRNGQFTVNIALLQGSRPIMGVVQVPATNKVYWAMLGQGAWVKEGDGQQKRLQVAEFGVADEGLVVVGSASHLTPETEQFVKQLKNPVFKQLGSSLKLLMVAEGEAHIYPRLAPTCEWDTAAAHAIVVEAGGTVLQSGKCDSKGKLLEDWQVALNKQDAVEYNKENPLNPFFIVYGKRKLEDGGEGEEGSSGCSVQ